MIEKMRLVKLKSGRGIAPSIIMNKQAFQFFWITVLLLTVFISCKKDKEDELATVPTLTTLPVSCIRNTSAYSGGNITNDGGSPVLERGIVWSTQSGPTITDDYLSNGGGNGNFGITFTGLTANTTYYVRAYATNAKGTAYGDELAFKSSTNPLSPHLNPGLSYGTMTDQEGNEYPTIVIGTQVWMAENLATSSYANGDPIPNVIDYTPWRNLSTGAWAYYQNKSEYGKLFGKLYNWYAVGDPRKICPLGWHVPTDAEWLTLKTYLGGRTSGREMKTIGTDYWKDPNFDATNESGFSALPGGMRYFSGSFSGFGESGFWWSSTDSADVAWSRSLRNGDNEAFRNDYNKNYGFCVRCLQD
jgi:uncharacterized protein (TIGR02145 family)